jgi:hypothetical protein
MKLISYMLMVFSGKPKEADIIGLIFEKGWLVIQGDKYLSNFCKFIGYTTSTGEIRKYLRCKSVLNYAQTHRIINKYLQLLNG